MNNDTHTQRRYTPCRTCPFRTDVAFVLTEGKAQRILTAISEDGDFPCHNTTMATRCLPGNEKGCIGAAIFLEQCRDGGLRANRAFRMREQLFKEFSRDHLDMSAPIFDSAAEFAATRTIVNGKQVPVPVDV